MFGNVPAILNLGYVTALFVLNIIIITRNKRFGAG